MARLIDADAFIKMMEEKCDHEAELDEIILSVCRGGIKQMPTVDAVEVVHGEWIRKEYNSDYPYYRMECSNCGGRMPRDQMTKEYYSDYCQNCGAKMDGGDK